MSKESYFIIERDQLPENMQVFAFNLYLFNPINKKYHIFLYANSPLVDAKLETLNKIIDKGAKLAIKMDQKRTFLSATGLNEFDILSLRNSDEKIIEKDKEEKQQLLNELDDEAFHISEEISKAIETDNFMPLIDRVRKEVMIFPVTVSHTVSLATYFAQKLMKEDNLTNRIVALTYLIAKTNKIDDLESLGDLVVACFLYDIGMTQMDSYLSHKNRLHFSDHEKQLFEKKPGLSHHLIRKTGLEISPRCLKIILEHTERADGSGYPNMKNIDKIEPLAMYLACVDHLLKFSAGIITGKKTPIQVVMNYFEKETSMPGLEFQFGENVRESIVYLLKKKKTAQAA